MANVNYYAETQYGIFAPGRIVTYQVYDNHNTAVSGVTGTALEAPVDATSSIYYTNVTIADTFQGAIWFTDGTNTANQTIDLQRNALTVQVPNPQTPPQGTYDVTTAIGLCRLYMTDTDTGNLIFSDTEVTSLLNNNNGDPVLAASDGLLIMATDKAKLSIVLSIGTFGHNPVAVAKQFLAMSKELRDRASMAPLTNANPLVFTMGNGTTVGSMDVW